MRCPKYVSISFQVSGFDFFEGPVCAPWLLAEVGSVSLDRRRGDCVCVADTLAAIRHGFAYKKLARRSDLGAAVSSRSSGVGALVATCYYRRRT